MSFLSRVPELESWLASAADDWSLLSVPEYLAFVNSWRATFESRLKESRSLVGNPLASIEHRLPFDAVLFTISHYEYIATSPGSGSSNPVYGYKASRLAHLDRELLARCDTIVSEAGLGFTCIYTHEAGSLWDPVFLQGCA